MNKISFDTAQICLEGHIINAAFERNPDLNRPNCQTCGNPTITKCQNPECGHTIDGNELIEHLPDDQTNMELYDYYDSINKPFDVIPPFCPYCGKPFPWTETKRQAVIDLAELEDKLSEEDKDIYIKNIDNLMTDTIQSEIAARRIIKLLKKAGIWTGQKLYDWTVDVASEAAKKILKGE